MIEKECPVPSHAEVDEVTTLLHKSSLEIPDKKKAQPGVASARSSARLQENSTIPASGKAKMLQSMGSSKMLQVSSSREFGRELTTNNSSMDAAASLPAFGKQKSIVSNGAADARGLVWGHAPSASQAYHQVPASADFSVAARWRLPLASHRGTESYKVSHTSFVSL